MTQKCEKREVDCGDSHCETHHAECAKNGECWHDASQCEERERLFKRLQLLNRTLPRGLDLAFAKVKKFHETFGAPVATEPTLLSGRETQRRIEWVKAELGELALATTLVDQVDAIVDAIYFLLGALVAAGVRPQVPFEMVHRANMAKVWPDGQVHRTEEGKVIKPPGWLGPEEEIALEIEHQRWEPHNK